MSYYLEQREEIRLDGRKMRTRENAHAVLKEAFRFPEYYGRNLDALWDMLTERKNLHILLTHTEELSAGEMGGLLELLREYAQEGHGLMLSLYPGEEVRGEGRIILNPLI